MIERLENNEAILLMYLADDLPLEDRLEVEQMLVADAGIRDTLEQYRSGLRQLSAGLTQLDNLEPIASETVATGKIVRRMRQHLLEQAGRPGSQAMTATPTLPLPWWMYPTAAAAAVLVAFATWVVNYAPTQHVPPASIYTLSRTQPADRSSSDHVESDAKVAELTRDIEVSFGPGSDAEQNDRQLLALRGNDSGGSWGDQDE